MTRVLLPALALTLLALPAAAQPGPYYYGPGPWYGPPHRHPPRSVVVIEPAPAPVIVAQPAPVVIVPAAPAPTTTAAAPPAYCREYQTTTMVGGELKPSYGTACQQPDGSWKIVATRP